MRKTFQFMKKDFQLLMKITPSYRVRSCYVQVTVNAHCYIWDTIPLLYLSQEKKKITRLQYKSSLRHVSDMIQVYCL